MSLNPKVTIRDMEAHDVKNIVDYWFDSPREYIEGMGVDWSKVPSRENLTKALLDKVENNNPKQSQLTGLVIEFEGRPVGVHSLSPVYENDYGIFHAHIFDTSLRGQGIGQTSYLLACQTFMKRFSLKKILFKTPAQNVGALKVKDRLGIPRVGEEIGCPDVSLLQEDCAIIAFELTPQDLQRLLKANQ